MIIEPKLDYDSNLEYIFVSIESPVLGKKAVLYYLKRHT